MEQIWNVFKKKNLRRINYHLIVTNSNHFAKKWVMYLQEFINSQWLIDSYMLLLKIINPYLYKGI